MTRVLFIGQAPSKTGTATHFFVNRHGDVPLAFLARISTDRFLREAEGVHLFDVWPGLRRRRASGIRPEGEHFDFENARHNASLLDLTDRRVILMGRQVAKVFRVPDTWPYFVPILLPPTQCAWVLPNPSGRNIWWNVPAHKFQGRDFLRWALGVLDPDDVAREEELASDESMARVERSHERQKARMRTYMARKRLEGGG